MKKISNYPINRRGFICKSAATFAALSIASVNSNAFSGESGELFASGGMVDYEPDLKSVCQKSGWATGGTKNMIAPFPPKVDPFQTGLGDLCGLQTESIIGPCYFDDVIADLDISEGRPGVPMALVFKVVDSECQPVEGAVVEAWWADVNGIYSADAEGSSNGVSEVNDYRGPASEIDGAPPFYPNLCVLTEDPAVVAEASVSKAFRGRQTTDSAGNAYFKGCFPGWYTGRAVHIHIRVTAGGMQSLVTQLGFKDKMASKIFVDHPDYTGEDQDTTNETDFIAFADANNNGNFMLEVDRQFDGSMLAYKALSLNG